MVNRILCIFLQSANSLPPANLLDLCAVGPDRPDGCGNAILSHTRVEYFVNPLLVWTILSIRYLRGALY